jgi:hypothetical protein
MYLGTSALGGKLIGFLEVDVLARIARKLYDIAHRRSDHQQTNDIRSFHIGWKVKSPASMPPRLGQELLLLFLAHLLKLGEPAIQGYQIYHYSAQNGCDYCHYDIDFSFGPKLVGHAHLPVLVIALGNGNLAGLLGHAHQRAE